MDLRSCPQEMLASVFKYTTFETVTRIRKTNKHMDCVATKYRMNLPRVIVATVSRYGKLDPKIYLEYKKKDIWDNMGKEDLQRLYSTNLIYNQANVLSVFEATVKNIRLTKYIAFMHGEIDRNVLDFLEKVKPKVKLSLYMRNCNFAVSVEELTLAFAKYQRNSEIIIKEENQIMKGPMGTDLIVKSLLPYTGLSFDYSFLKTPLCPALTDESLRVARECLPHSFQVYWHSPFSLAEIKKTMLHLIDSFEQKEKKFKSWKFGYLQFDSKEQLDRAFKEITAIPGTIIEFHREHYAKILYNGEKYWNLFEIGMELR